MLESHELRLLTEVGLLAAAVGDITSSQRIFQAVSAQQPQALGAYVGMAMAYLNAGRADDAVAELDRARAAIAPDDLQTFHAVRGLALRLAGRASESRQALTQAGDLTLAKALLAEPSAA